MLGMELGSQCTPAAERIVRSDIWGGAWCEWTVNGNEKGRKIVHLEN